MREASKGDDNEEDPIQVERKDQLKATGKAVRTHTHSGGTAVKSFV
jgi:hypothetical protein